MHENSRWPSFSHRPKTLAAASILAAGLIAGCTANQVTETAGNSPGTAQTDSACAHSECVTGAKLKSGCDSCVTSVCDEDSYCCKTKWDSQCVSEVATYCSPDPCTGGNPDMSQPPQDMSKGSPDLSKGNPDLSKGSPDLSSGGGSVGAGGGTVDHLFFAVSGDTRPADIDDPSGYPTAIIQKIYQDIEAMSPRPYFAVATGDYQYATSTGTEGAPQLALYAQARAAYSGVLFAAMGNHECDGYTADNCTAPTNNFNAYSQYLLQPIGQSLPYYSIPINATDGSWTSKLLVIACNYWSSTQQSWLQTQLAKTTTYTILVRHEPADATTAPCVSAVESLMAQYPYNLSITGHTHHFAQTGSDGGKEFIVGNGGAPLTSGDYTYGYVTVEQTSAGFVVTDYDYSTAQPVSSVTVPF